MNKFIYFTNYAKGEKELHDLEFRILFNANPLNRILISEVDLDSNRSIFIKEKLRVLCYAKSFDELLVQIEKNNYDYENLRVDYLKYENLQVTYEERLRQMSAVGATLKGEANIHHPDITLAITVVDDIFYFGIKEKCAHGCDKRQNKPYSYSVSCSTRVARVLSNLAVEHDLNRSIIDPCCGIGTIVLELLTIGVKEVCANELLEKVAKKAEKNLAHYNYQMNVKIGDVKKINQVYDVAILDIPYGHFIKQEEDNQKNILKECARIADKIILLSHVEMNEDIKEVGFRVIDQCTIDKGNFRRYVTIASKMI